MISTVIKEIEDLVTHGISPVGRLAGVLLANPQILTQIDEARTFYADGQKAGAINWIQLFQMIISIVQQVLPLLIPPAPVPIPTPPPVPAA